jgi:hypothetical protein
MLNRSAGWSVDRGNRVASLRCSFGALTPSEPSGASSVPSQNCAHPALNAQAAGPLTGTYSRLTKKPRANPKRSMEAFTILTRRHFNLFTLLQQGYTLQTLVYQGCSTLVGMMAQRRSASPQTLALRHQHMAPSPQKEVRTALCSCSHEMRVADDSVGARCELPSPRHSHRRRARQV